MVKNFGYCNKNWKSILAKTASERVVQKPAEATGDLIGNKIADKITSIGKSKNKEKEDQTNEIEQIHIPPEKSNKLLMHEDCFGHSITLEYQKITNLLGNILDKVPKFIAKKWIELSDQSGTVNNGYKPSKQIRFKPSMLQSNLCNYSDAYIVVKELLALQEQIIMHMRRS